MNAVYPAAKEAFLDAAEGLLSGTIRMQAYDAAVYNAAHDFLNDVAGTKVGAAVTLTGKATTGGKFTATVPTFTWPTAHTVTALVVYDEGGGTDATRRLLGFIDRRGDSSPLSVPTNGGTVTLTWTGPILSIGGL
jgi:hypothetical protein